MKHPLGDWVRRWPSGNILELFLTTVLAAITAITAITNVCDVVQPYMGYHCAKCYRHGLLACSIRRVQLYNSICECDYQVKLEELQFEIFMRTLWHKRSHLHNTHLWECRFRAKYLRERCPRFPAPLHHCL